jgi:hypothetical protein
MPVVKLAVTALGVLVTVARHPVVRAGVRAVTENPKLREGAVKATKSAAYNAGVLARRIIPRSLIQ